MDCITDVSQRKELVTERPIEIRKTLIIENALLLLQRHV